MDWSNNGDMSQTRDTLAFYASVALLLTLTCGVVRPTTPYCSESTSKHGLGSRSQPIGVIPYLSSK
jgi:hypothetical protein